MAVLISSKVWVLFIAFAVMVVFGSPTMDLLESVDCLLRRLWTLLPKCWLKNGRKLNCMTPGYDRFSSWIAQFHGSRWGRKYWENSGSWKPGITATDLIKQVGDASNCKLQLHCARLFALSKDCQQFLLEVKELADLGMKFLYRSWSFSGIQCDLPDHK